MDYLGTIVDLAQQGRIVCIDYQKPTDAEPTKRWVEPYELQESGAGTVMIECWQRRPSILGEAWRHFRLDRIMAACDGGETFEPRKPVTVHTGQVFEYVYQPPALLTPMTILSTRPQPANPTPAWEYQRYVDAILRAEARTAEDFKNAKILQSALTKDEVRSVHALVYASMLSDAASDGKVELGEIRTLTTMKKTLKRLGWVP